MMAGRSDLPSPRVMTVQVRDEAGVVVARQRARQIAALVGFGNPDQVRIATAVSEVARNALRYGGGGRVEFSLLLSDCPRALLIVTSDQGPGIADLDDVLAGRRKSTTGMGLGLMGTRRLMDRFEIETAPERGTTVRLTKYLPAESPLLGAAGLSGITARLGADAPSPSDELQIQNRELVETLESLRLREIELEKRQSELRRINAELEETNRGVVALYAELDEKAAALRSADELKSRFLRHVSHEFRTPLNSILALSGLLLRRTDGELTSEQERQVGFIRKATQDLTEMVNDLLDLAKVESGKTDVHLGPIQLGQLFGTMRGLLRPLVNNDTVSLIFEDPVEEVSFESDEAKVAQILRNLVSNALKFTERGEIRISYQVSSCWLRIHVADTGIGIGPEDQERIFQEFTQVHNPIQGRVKGTGLGLPLSRKLATLLGGELTVESRLGAGSRFTLCLPVGEAHASAAMAAGADCILVIDDDESARYIVRQWFRGTTHRLIEACRGIEGAERARFERPVLILLDLGLPDRNGFEVLEDLKSAPETSHIPVFIHTSRKLTPSDYERLANRQTAVLPKGEDWPESALDMIRSLLKETTLFQAVGSGDRQGVRAEGAGSNPPER